MSQPSYIRANDVIYVIFLMHAQAVDARLSFSTHPRIRAWERGMMTIKNRALSHNYSRHDDQ